MNPTERIPDRGRVLPFNTKVHPTAVVAPGAQLGADVEIGPYAIIGENVVIGDGTVVGAHAVVEGWTVLGKRNRIYTGAVIGNDPQDRKFKGEKSYLFVGDENTFREYCTVSRGTEGGGGETRIGNNNLFMSYSHLGHDAQVGNDVVVGHASGVGGHVIIEDKVIIGGLCGIHQFTKIGRMTMVGAHTMITKDVPPYALISGNPAKVYGVNTVGLRRNGLSPETRMEIQRAYKILYRSTLNVSQAIEEMERELPGSEEIDHFIRFLRNAERGIYR